MTEEELKNKCKERAKIFQQAMESCKSSSPIDCIEWFADRIAELEKENEQLTISYETLKLHDEEEIGMLKSENAELKDDNKVMADNYSKMEQKFYDNLTKAKKLLGYIVKYYREDEDLGLAKEINEAEQFLKE